MSRLLEPFHMQGGAIPALLFFITAFAAVLFWSLRKNLKPLHNKLSQLPFEKENS